MNSRATRLERLEAIRGLSMEGRYEDALREISEFLGEFPDDLEAKRLQANTLELKVLDRAQYRVEKLMRSAEYSKARQCYEEILEADPTNTLALIDLGDHFGNLGAYDKAKSYYEQAINALRQGKSEVSWTNEVNEVFDRYVDLCQHVGLPDEQRRLEREREALLSNKT